MSLVNAEVIDCFETNFSVAIAISSEQKHDVFSIRYNVYCREFGWEEPNKFPDELEKDEFDEQSLHCLITHKSTGLPAGCVRLVPPRSEISAGLLPFEKYCGESLEPNFFERLVLGRDTICEISRLAVNTCFRRRMNEFESRVGRVLTSDFSEEEQRTFPLLSIAAFLAATALTEITGRRNVFSVIEPFLSKLMRRYAGLNFRRAGRDIEHHGIRAVNYITTQSALENMKEELRPLYWLIKSELLRRR